MTKRELDMQLKKTTLDDLFTTQSERDEANLEKIYNINIKDIDNFPNHPYKVIKNEDMDALVESIKENGILVPIIVRKKDDGRYELISGHRRKFASELSGITTIPCIVRDVSEAEATIMMVDSNTQREKILPSEKAFAYKMKHDALKHQGRTSDQVGPKLTTEEIGKENGDSSSKVKRFMRLTNLNKEILDLVDNERIAISPAAEISYLTSEEQSMLLDFMQMYDATPSHSQAIKLKKLSQDHNLTGDKIDEIMSVEKPNQMKRLNLNESRIRSVLPKNIKESKIEEFIVKSIEHYRKYLQRQMDSR